MWHLNFCCYFLNDPPFIQIFHYFWLSSDFFYLFFLLLTIIIILLLWLFFLIAFLSFFFLPYAAVAKLALDLIHELVDL